MAYANRYIRGSYIATFYLASTKPLRGGNVAMLDTLHGILYHNHSTLIRYAMTRPGKNNGGRNDTDGVFLLYHFTFFVSDIPFIHAVFQIFSLMKPEKKKRILYP